MDAKTFAFYLGQDPATYTAAGPATFERVLKDLQAIHGYKAEHMGLAFLAMELHDYTTLPEANRDLVARITSRLAEPQAPQ